MTQTISGVPPDLFDPGQDHAEVPWEVPEIAATAVLVAVGALIVGGLATGVLVANSAELPYAGLSQQTWNAIAFGTAWANPLVAIVLLGVMGLCWWRADRWIERPDDEPRFAAGHLGRVRRIAVWAVVGLLISAVAAVASLAAVIGFNIPSHAPQLVATRVIPTAASAIGVIAVVSAGVATRRRIRLEV